MLECKVLGVYGLEEAIHGMRNPMNSWDRSDSYEERTLDGDTEYVVGDCDLRLMHNLFTAGTEHRKYARMITCYLDINSNHTFWAEFDTYKVGTVRNSCSKMHKIHVKEFVRTDFDHEGIYGVGGATVEIFYSVVQNLEWLRKKFNETQDKTYWRAIIELLPMGYRIKATVMINYEVAANIIRQRKNHKLDEWHTLVDELMKLPYMAELIGNE